MGVGAGGRDSDQLVSIFLTKMERNTESAGNGIGLRGAG